MRPRHSNLHYFIVFATSVFCQFCVLLYCWHDLPNKFLESVYKTHSCFSIMSKFYWIVPLLDSPFQVPLKLNFSHMHCICDFRDVFVDFSIRFGIKFSFFDSWSKVFSIIFLAAVPLIYFIGEFHVSLYFTRLMASYYIRITRFGIYVPPSDVFKLLLVWCRHKVCTVRCAPKWS